MQISRHRLDSTLYSTPFCRGYWKCAAQEFFQLRSLTLAALFIALRVVLKPFNIPVAENLYISFDFLVNSVGSMIYGPLVGLLVGACSDTLGAILFPVGPYFFPFIFVEMMSSFLFGLFLYRAKLGEIRIVLSRFCVVVICNFIMNPVLLKWYYQIFYGKDYALFRWARVVKNLCLFPAEALLLTLWLGSIATVTYRLGLIYSKPKKLKLSARVVILAILLTLLAAGCILFYVFCYAK